MASTDASITSLSAAPRDQVKDYVVVSLLWTRMCFIVELLFCPVLPVLLTICPLSCLFELTFSPHHRVRLLLHGLLTLCIHLLPMCRMNAHVGGRDSNGTIRREVLHALEQHCYF